MALIAAAALWTANGEEAQAGIFDCSVNGFMAGPGDGQLYLHLDSDTCDGSFSFTGDFLGFNQVAEDEVIIMYYLSGINSAGATLGGSPLSNFGTTGLATDIDCTSGCLIEFEYNGTDYAIGYTFSGLTGTVTDESSPSAPEIDVSSSEGGAVGDGTTDSWISTPVAESASTVTYTVSNTGTGTLTLDPVSVLGNISGASNVTVNSLTLGSTSVAPDGDTTLVVNYTPALAGAFSWNLDITSDDADEETYDIAASGSASGSPEIDVSSSESGAVGDGTTDSWVSSPVAGSASTVTYTVSNTGTDTLTLDPVSVGNISDASNVTVNSVTLGSTSVAPSGDTTLVVNYTPALAGAFSWNLDITSDDADEETYDIAASGSASGSPEIDVSSSEGGAVADGTTDSWISSPVAGSASTVTYTVSNTGTDTLTLDPVSVGNISDASNVTVNSVTLGSTSVAPKSDTTLVVNYTPALAGAFSWNLDITSDDADEEIYDIAASGTAVSPEIDVSSSEGGVVADGGTDGWTSSPVAGTASTVTYTITNNGDSTLTLSAPTLANIQNADNVTVHSLTLGSTTVAGSGGSTTLVANYTPAAAGDFKWDLSLDNDDLTENPYNIEAAGTAVSPEIAVSSSEGGVVADGGTDGWTSSPVAGTASTVTYTITNNGDSTLTLSAPTVGTNIQNADNVTVHSLTLDSTTVAGSGGSTTLVVNYTPAAPGDFKWDLSLDNDDLNESPYNIEAAGTAVLPEITVTKTSGSAAFASGDTDALGGGFTAGVQQTVQYTIRNSGTGDLTLGTPTEAGSGNVSIDSLALSPAGSTLAAGASTVLTVTYTPALDGAFSWELNLTSSDADEGTYVFKAAGNATGAPEIDVAKTSDSSAVSNGATDALGSGFTAGVEQTVQYTITNSGTADLTLGTPSADSASNVSTGSLSLSSTTVGAGSTAELTAAFTPAADGNFSFVLTLTSNDADESPHSITVSGSAAGVPAALAATSGSGQSAELNASFPAPLVATVTDANGLPVSNVSVTFTAPASGASLTFASSGNRTETVLTDAGGVAESSAMTANGTASAFSGGALQPYSVTASAAGLEDAVFSLTNNRDSEADIVKTQEVIASFVSNRGDRIVGAQPDLVPRLRDALSLRRSGGNTLSFRDTEGGQTLSFNLSYRSLEALMDGLRAAPAWTPPQTSAPGPLDALAQTGSVPANQTQVMAFSGAGAEKVLDPLPEGRFDIWAQGSIAMLDNRNGSSRNGFIFAGADYRASQDAIIGIMGQLDLSEEDNPSENTTAEGTGWMAGPYAVVRLQDNLFFDGRLTFGKSYNEVNALGLFTDEFDTSRLLAQAGLTGDVDMGSYRISPFARVTYYREKQETFTDSLGNIIPSQTFDLGRFEFGPEITYRTQDGQGNPLTLNMSLSGVYDFDEMQETPATNTGLLSSAGSLRARLKTGLIYRVPEHGLVITGELFYDGIGVSGFKATGGSISLRIPL